MQACLWVLSPLIWVLFCPTFLSVKKMSFVFVLCNLVKKLNETDQLTIID